MSKTKEQLLLEKLELQEQLLYKKASEDFLTFVKVVAPTIVADFKLGKHIIYLCRKLQAVAEGKILRLAVMLPPRSTKSVLCSKLFPAFYFGLHARREYMILSHKDDLAETFGREVRNLIDSDLYKRIFPETKISRDSRAAVKWSTTAGGSFNAAGVKSKIAGKGAHCATLDDAGAEDLALTKSGREYIQSWYVADFLTRLMPNGAVIMVGTRFHFDDLIGFAIGDKTIPWDVVKIPAWLDKKSAELLGLPEGHSYFPEWKSDEELRNLEASITRAEGSFYWSALFMQDPVPESGGLIKREWFKTWDDPDPPDCDYIFFSLDTAFSTKETADFSVIQVWGVFQKSFLDLKGRQQDQNNLILLSQKKVRMVLSDLINLIKVQNDKFKPDMILVEDKGSGQSIIPEIRRANLPASAFNPGTKDKEFRVNVAIPVIESGRIWLPKDRAFADEFLKEVLAFPKGAHDDAVDALTQAVIYLRKNWEITAETDEDKEDRHIRRRKTYFSALSRL